MSFVNPLLALAGTAFVALPIVLHLIMRRKPKRLEFPALRFVKLRHEMNRRRLRLRHLLLLLLRTAAIALLALALGRPSVRPSARLAGVLGSQEAPVAAALVFDASPRMEYRHQNSTRLEVAGELGLWLLAQLPRQSQIAVLDTRLGPGAFQVDRGVARQRIEKLATVANSQPLTSVIEEALRLLAQSELAAKEIYVFTDLARVAWPEDSAARLRSRAAELPEVAIYLIDVGIESPVDFALGEVKLAEQVLSTRSPLRVASELVSTGADTQQTVEVYLLDADRRPQKRDQRSLALASGESQEVDFGIGSLSEGTHQGFLRIVGEDALGCNNTRFFSVEVRSAWRILIAAPEPGRQQELFLAEALAPESYRRSGLARFDCRVIRQDELQKEDLQRYAAVCLLDPGPLEPALWQKLAGYASEGHGVGIFLGRSAGVEFFNKPSAQELLPGPLLRQARRPDGSTYLAPLEFQHPVLAAFADWADSTPWDASAVYRYWQLGELAAGVGVIAPFTDGQPALLERPLGAGRVLTMTTPVSDRPDRKPWNLLPVDVVWPFYVLAQQMMSYLVGSSDRQLNYFAGQTAVVPLEAQGSYRSYLLTVPGEMKFPLAADPKKRALVVSSTDQPGNYRIQAGGRDSGVDYGFSVNLAAEQTQLERLSEEELAAIFDTLEYRLARNRLQLERDQQRGRVGRELFPLLVMLIAVVLGLEYLVANRFYRQ